jgi:transketolase
MSDERNPPSETAAAPPAARRTRAVDPFDVRRIVLEQSKRANVGHIGSCLCVTEILCSLYGNVLRVRSPADPDRDRFVLSKGHAALALYAVLALKGWIDESRLRTFCGDDSLLGVHPEAALPGVDFSTGSLGHGPSFAVGAALAARWQRSDRRVYCLISDAECNAGALWEAAMFAGHHRLDRLTFVVDLNGQQALGLIRDVIDQSNLAERWAAFGWDVSEVDGHSVPALDSVLAAASPNGSPRVVLARTVFGKGVSFMEQGACPTDRSLPAQPINWHYLPMSDTEYGMAMEELRREREKGVR